MGEYRSSGVFDHFGLRYLIIGFHENELTEVCTWNLSLDEYLSHFSRRRFLFLFWSSVLLRVNYFKIFGVILSRDWMNDCLEDVREKKNEFIEKW